MNSKSFFFLFIEIFHERFYNFIFGRTFRFYLCIIVNYNYIIVIEERDKNIFFFCGGHYLFTVL